MNAEKFAGKRVRLAALDLEKDGDLWARWNRDSEYQSLLDWGPTRLYSATQTREWIEKTNPASFIFSIHSLEDDQIIGFVELGDVRWTCGDGWLGVGVGERDYWGKGFGTDAIDILLRFAFEELNLKRISLNVFEYNERAIKAYEKLGFQHEGRQRKIINRFAERWDMIYMGILRREWEARQALT